ncbi:ftsH [Symbiodinium microadriaticum]|nr:ftsH [Symbiodinium microadriaticum]
MENTKEELQEVIAYLRDPNRFYALGARPPRGILLAGPSGTGKTLMARAVAGEAGVPFLYASSASFVEIFVGQGAQRIRQFFEQARACAPCIVFLDELDAVGSSRQMSASGGGGNQEYAQTLNQLLLELEPYVALFRYPVKERSLASECWTVLKAISQAMPGAWGHAEERMCLCWKITKIRVEAVTSHNRAFEFRSTGARQDGPLHIEVDDGCPSSTELADEDDDLGDAANVDVVMVEMLQMHMYEVRMEVNETAGARSSEQRQEDPWAGYMLTRNKEASTRSAANASRPDSNGDDGGLTDEERLKVLFNGAAAMQMEHRLRGSAARSTAQCFRKSTPLLTTAADCPTKRSGAKRPLTAPFFATAHHCRGDRTRSKWIAQKASRSCLVFTAGAAVCTCAGPAVASASKLAMVGAAAAGTVAGITADAFLVARPRVPRPLSPGQRFDWAAMRLLDAMRAMAGFDLVLVFWPEHAGEVSIWVEPISVGDAARLVVGKKTSAEDASVMGALDHIPSGVDHTFVMWKTNKGHLFVSERLHDGRVLVEDLHRGTMLPFLKGRAMPIEDLAHRHGAGGGPPGHGTGAAAGGVSPAAVAAAKAPAEAAKLISAGKHLAQTKPSCLSVRELKSLLPADR